MSRHAIITQANFITALYDVIGDDIEVTPSEGRGVWIRLTVGKRVAWRNISGGDLSTRTLAAVAHQAGRLLSGGTLPDPWAWE